MMKKRLICAILLPLCLAGCARSAMPAETTAATQPQTAAAPTEAQTEVVPTTIVLPQDLPAADYDLSDMSKTMMYSQVYDMIYNPDAYRGKTVRILGPFNRYTDEETGEEHSVCIIRDATACCTQGIEFELTDPAAPVLQDGDTVLVSGTFDTYMSGPFLYCVLRNAVLEYPAAN